MKKRFLITTLVLALSLLFITTVLAQTYPDAGNAVTNAVLQNSGSSTATIVVTYYDANGTKQYDHTGISLAAGAVTEVKTQDEPLPSGFQGTAVVSSDQPLASVVSIKSTGVTASAGQTTQAAYNGTSSPATTLFFPSVWRFSGIVSIVTIQNTENTSASVTVDFYDRNGNKLGTCNETLAAFGSKTYDMRTPPSCSGWTDAVADGSITATSSGPKLAGASTAAWSNRAAAYQALTSADQGTVLYAPSHFRFKKNASDAEYTLFSAINIQNTDPNNDAPITVEYFTRGDTSGTPALTINTTVPAGSAIGLNTKNGASVAASTFDPLGTSWDGSVKITSDNGIPLIGTGITNWGTAGYAGMYALVSDSSASDTIYVPAQYRRMPNGSWAQWSAINLQNIGSTTVAASDLTITYIDQAGNTVATFTGASLPSDLAPGAAFGMNTRNGGDLSASAFDSLGDSFIGGIIVQGPIGSQLVAVNNIIYSNRASVYNGIGISTGN
ncbi:MAG: hypothetical protein D6706_20480 [Chloroflexi bacterium]|nr:MAG: hypothetical protein D6706_20480 [Chloroflexota bacterium]